MNQHEESPTKSNVDCKQDTVKTFIEGVDNKVLPAQHPVDTAIRIGCELVGMMEARKRGTEDSRRESNLADARDTASLIGELSGEIFKAMRQSMRTQGNPVSGAAPKAARMSGAEDESVSRVVNQGSNMLDVSNPAATAMSIAHDLLRPSIKSAGQEGGLDFIAARSLANQVGEIAGQILQTLRTTAGTRGGGLSNYPVDPYPCSVKCGCVDPPPR